ncbi:hypothetical protein Lal_00028172 [Lupinus albus]|nr:hypothetical protein Lal_00028172 [Lupinus albus]
MMNVSNVLRRLRLRMDHSHASVDHITIVQHQAINWTLRLFTTMEVEAINWTLRLFTTMEVEDRQCADIIGISASELRNQMVAEGDDDPKAYPLPLDMQLARTMIVRVKVQPSYSQCFVIRLSENPTLINSIDGQFGLLELHTGSTSEELKGKCHVNDIFQYESSVFITADHDPDNLQVLTPAKRMSTDLGLDLLESPLYKTTKLSFSKVTKRIKIE